MTDEPAVRETTFEADERCRTRSQYRSLAARYRRVTAILLDAERWLPVLRKQDPELDVERLADRMASERREILARMEKLGDSLRANGSAHRTEKLLSASERHQWGGLPPRGWPDFRDREWRRYIGEARWLDRRLGVQEVFVAECDSDTGIATLAEVSDTDVFVPSDEETTYESGFQNETLDDELCVKFVDNYIDNTATGDYFESTRVLTFEIPPVPCDGTLKISVAGSLSVTPNIMAIHGSVSPRVETLLSLAGDGTDPSDLDLYLDEVSIYAYESAASGEYLEPFPITEIWWRDWEISVAEDDQAVARVAVTNVMSVSYGEISYVGLSAIDVAQVCIGPPGWVESEGPGVWWQFVPQS